MPVVLTELELEHFYHRGFVILRQAVPSEAALDFAETSIFPRLEDCGYKASDPGTWTSAKSLRRTQPAGGWTSGAMHKLREQGGTGPDVPLPFPELLSGERLIGALDDLHGGGEERRWSKIPSKLGWVHVRNPLQVLDPVRYAPDLSCWSHPKIGWHIDGIHTHKFEVGGCILLPMFSKLERYGGGTLVVEGSHKRVAQWLHKAGAAGIGHARLQVWLHVTMGDLPVVEAAPCEPGDVVIMHPLLVHNCSHNHRAVLRVAFNLRIACAWELDDVLERFKQDPLAVGPVARVYADVLCSSDVPAGTVGQESRGEQGCSMM